MGRGRSRFSQQGAATRNQRYGLTGVPRNSHISVDFDKYRRNLPEHRAIGTITSRVGQRCTITWREIGERVPDLEPGDLTTYPESEVRFWVDSGRARITQPTRKTILDEKKD